MVKQWIFCGAVWVLALYELIPIESTFLERLGGIILSLVITSAVYLLLLWIFEGERKL